VPTAESSNTYSKTNPAPDLPIDATEKQVKEYFYGEPQSLSTYMNWRQEQGLPPLK
jgi:hypothetical protein